jgi:hypothetical protein
MLRIAFSLSENKEQNQNLALLQSLTLAFFGPLEGRTEPLTFVTNFLGIKLCDALALRDHLHQFPGMTEHLKKNLRLQFSSIIMSYSRSYQDFDH